MLYSWLVTVQRSDTDAFVYTPLGKVQYTRVELQYMGFKIYTLEDFYSFIAEHTKPSTITLAALQFNYISYKPYATPTSI